MATHKLKITQPFFDDVKNGIKKFELRRNDRNFKVGDEVYLQEYDMVHHLFSGEEVYVKIIYVLENRIGLEDDFCIFGFEIYNNQFEKRYE